MSVRGGDAGAGDDYWPGCLAQDLRGSHQCRRVWVGNRWLNPRSNCHVIFLSEQVERYLQVCAPTATTFESPERVAHRAWNLVQGFDRAIPSRQCPHDPELILQLMQIAAR